MTMHMGRHSENFRNLRLEMCTLKKKNLKFRGFQYYKAHFFIDLRARKWYIEGF